MTARTDNSKKTTVAPATETPDTIAPISVPAGGEATSAPTMPPPGKRLVSFLRDDSGGLPKGITFQQDAVLRVMQRYQEAEGNPAKVAEVLAIEYLLCEIDAVLAGRSRPTAPDLRDNAMFYMVANAAAAWIRTETPYYINEDE